MKQAFIKASLLILFVFPASGNYKLDRFGFSSGGTGESASTNYKTSAESGEVSDNQNASTNFAIGPGLAYVEMANTLPAPSFTNPSSYYNKLLLVINSASNPTDATFAVAISTDNFSTTNYVQSDNTVGAALGPEDWQTYTNWGGGSGENVIGLSANTTYYVKVKAEQGDYSETPWGPVASVATSDVSLSFDIDVSASDTETSSPYAINMGNLIPGSVVTSTERIWVDLDTNADYGGYVYIYDSESGLRSTTVSHTISSITGDLAAASSGYGMQSASVAQSSGGPFVALSPYNGASQNVGIVTTTAQPIYSSSNLPIAGGRGSFYAKAIISSVTPAASDYSDVVTLIASAVF